MTLSRHSVLFFFFLVLTGVIVVCDGLMNPVHSSIKVTWKNSVYRVGNFPNSPNFYGIIDEDYSFPNDSDFYMLVVESGEFHGDEVMENIEEKDWFGIFEGSDGYYLAEAKLEVEQVVDEILDRNEGEITGKMVSTMQSDPAMLFFESNDLISPHRIEQALIGKGFIYPEDTVRFEYLGIPYEIFATGNKEQYEEELDYFVAWSPDDLLYGSEWYAVWNYKLYISAMIGGKKCQSLLAVHPYFDDNMTSVLFGGDIDGDGVLDLIIDNSYHYNMFLPTLYLSKPAEAGQIMRPVGAHRSVGC